MGYSPLMTGAKLVIGAKFEGLMNEDNIIETPSSDSITYFLYK